MNRKNISLRYVLVLALVFLGLVRQSSVLGAPSAKKKTADTALFRYPLRTAPELSGSFAELRNNHFHGGMDLRTEQREGLRVYSAAPGLIVRAGVSNVSYGKVLYVQHDNGMVTVYAHLSKFCASVQKLVRKQQKQSGRYETSLTGLQIPVKKNKPIARSGNTGSSGGPHLHFEILQDTLRLNPALYGIRIEDSVPPALLYLAFYSHRDSARQADTVVLPDTDSLMQESFMDAPASDYAMQKAIEHEYDSLLALSGISDTLCADRPSLFRLPKTIEGEAFTAHYFRADSLPDTLYLHQKAAFGVCVLDSIQQMPFHYGLFKLLFAVRETGSEKADTLAYYCLDALSLRTCAELNRHIDLPFYGITRKRLEKSYLDDGQCATPYRVMNNRGVFVPQKGRSYTLIINMEDVSGNRTALQLPLVCK
ncbi:MAG: M23 family metallopeptidase [Bacteroides sp.]|nr:M23 family metallopeptidase [Bacteroides sp.]MCM1085484.1 M23 family metallopeptidase [Bacteroides sp.]